MKIEYNIIDTECLEDYFSYQFKTESMTDVRIIECYDDNGIKRLYNGLNLATKPMYFYSIDYDTVMLNAMCKMVEKNIIGMNYKLRKFSDMIIQNKLNYFRLNREFWCDHYFKNNDFNKSIATMKLLHPEHEVFFEEYNYLLGKSKLINNLIINSIPKIYYYYNVAQDKTLKPSISLKKLQLIKEGYNVKFDFANYKTIKEIKEQGLYKKWIKYSKNDVLSLEKLYLDKPYKDIVKRYYAFKAVKSIDKDFEINSKSLYAENNTELITSILKLKNPNKDIDIDYNELIKTHYKKFNDFVSFVNQNNNIKSDKEIKEKYCEMYKREYIQDDENRENDTLINSFDTIVINGTTIKIGLGGCHGAIEKYVGENLLHLDYDGQYPSIILQYKEYFKNIINVDLYESIYKLRIESKRKLKTLDENSEEYKELNLIVSGLKLILNTSYGLINSNFDLAITNKKLGRFICLKGQSLLLNLIYKLGDVELINVNTDGVILKTDKDIMDVVKNDKDGYFNLGVDKIKSLIQKDVNSYIKDNKVKGSFNISIKQNINRHERISVNTINAIRLIQNKEVKIYPIYFDVKWIDKEEKRYYFTTKEKGQQAIKQTKKPEILTISNEIMYFTDIEKDADLEIYKKYAEIVRNKILDFTFVNSENKNLKYIECQLSQDTDENIKLKRKLKRDLHKLFSKDNIGLIGYKGDNKACSYYPDKGPIKPLVHYTMTDILKSTYCKGFSVHDYLIIDVDLLDRNTGKLKKGYEICNDLIKKLKEAKTFECWNNQTEHFNRKFIFQKNDSFKLDEKYKSYIEILDHASVLSIDGLIKYDCNWCTPK